MTRGEYLFLARFWYWFWRPARARRCTLCSTRHWVAAPTALGFEGLI